MEHSRTDSTEFFLRKTVQKFKTFCRRVNLSLGVLNTFLEKCLRKRNAKNVNSEFFFVARALPVLTEMLYGR